MVLLACAPSEDSCARYAEAAAACATDAGLDATGYAAETLCGAWDRRLESAYGPDYACRAEVVEAADCTDAAQADAALSDAGLLCAAE